MSAKKKLEEIALLLVMTDGSDAMGVEALRFLLDGFLATVKSEFPNSEMESALSSLIEETVSGSGKDLISRVGKFVSAAQAFFENVGKPDFSNSKLVSKDSEFGQNFDLEFIADFIEKHTHLLEEFDGALTKIRFNRAPSKTDISDFRQFARKYLHNIKGDAGSIGLQGIERVTHVLEDVAETLLIGDLLELLAQFVDWTRRALTALTQGTPFPTSSVDFHKKLTAKLTEVPVPGDLLNEISLEPALESSSRVESTLEIPESYSISCEQDLFSEFASEAEDHLGNVEVLLLEKSQALDPEDIDSVFRGVHSLKGASSYFNLVEMNRTSHNLENLLDEARSGKRAFDSKLEELTLQWIDLQKQYLSAARGAMKSGKEIRSTPLSFSFLETVKAYGRGERLHEDDPKGFVESRSGVEDSLQSLRSELSSLAVETTEGEGRKEGPEAHTEKVGIKTFVKVDTQRLDRLIDSIGEMVIYSSMLIRTCRDVIGHNEQVIQTTDQVEKFSRELQDIGMSMRLDPIRGLFQKMSRLVWDMSRKLKKDIHFSMKGEDTELDRTVIERLADPLMHMVRNALDHGIEPAEERIAKGKSPSGKIELSAAHSGGSIVVTIIDDGRGLDAEKLVKKAREKGIIGPEEILSPEEAYQLIFAPGFSTAAVVSDISGRGVGMDVVRTNIQNLRGQIRIESELHKGTVFTIELPLTLAIIDGVETTVGEERFIFPTLSVVEFMKPQPNMFSITMGRGETFSFRGQFLPVYRLARLFEIPSASADTSRGIVAVIDTGKEMVAMVVDDIVGSCQTVIKRLGEVFPTLNGVAGCAIMPNGDIGLILDPRELVQLARRDYQPALENPSGSNIVDASTLFLH